jgi:hypothetical protein
MIIKQAEDCTITEFFCRVSIGYMVNLVRLTILALSTHHNLFQEQQQISVLL